MDEYLDEEVESVKHALEVICKGWDREVRNVHIFTVSPAIDIVLLGFQLITRDERRQLRAVATPLFVLAEPSPSETQRSCFIHFGTSATSDHSSAGRTRGWRCVDDGWERRSAGYRDAESSEMGRNWE